MRSIFTKYGPIVLGALVLLCQRTFSLAVHPVWFWITQAVMVMCLMLIAKKHARLAVLTYCVVIPLCSWLLDISDGAESIVLGAAFFVMAECAMRSMGKYPLLRAFVCALAATVMFQLGTALVLMAGREMTIGGALVYAFTRHWWEAAAYFVGAQALWLDRQ